MAHLSSCSLAPRPYATRYYHPGQWRKRLDFGTGTFGDMGCHIFDPVFESLALTAPISIRSEGPAPDRWNWSINAHIKYVFPGTKYTAGKTVNVTWYDGDAVKPKEVLALVGAEKEPSDRKQGSIIVGTEGVLHVPHISVPKLFPHSKFAGYKLPDTSNTHHWSDWAEACVGGPGNPLAPFDYSGPLTESVLLGSVAVRFPQTTLEWDAANLAFRNEKDANQHLRRSYRKGCEMAGLL